MARAVGLLGARCALSGVHPNIARTIVHMGVELHGLKSYRTMRDALRYCVADAARMKRRK
jgi:rsbT co-antagonist protein RsbR